MNKFREYSDRRGDASKAKEALLQRFMKATTAPDLAAKQAARAELAQARDIRQAARETVKLAEQQRVASEAAAIAEEEALRQSAEAEAAKEKQSAHERRIALVLSDEAARKTARDLRYAKRKAAQQFA